jgi:hypothetical protein
MKTLFFGDCLEYLKNVCPVPAKAEGFIKWKIIQMPVSNKIVFKKSVKTKMGRAKQKGFFDNE